MNLIMMVVTAVAFLINPRLGALLLLLAAGYFMLTEKGSLYARLLKVIVYSSAYYTFDIFGGRQRLSVCIAAVAVLCVLLTFNMLKRGAKVSVCSACKLIALIVFLGAYGLSIWTSHDLMETVFATYHLVLLAYLIFIIPVAKNEELMLVDTESLLKVYIRGICAVAITLFIQYGAKTILGISLGEVYEFNSDRVIYNVYFYSKSVLSLYLAVGLLYYFVEYINNKRFFALIWMGVFTGAILINNSRTGLMCFAVCAGLYCIRNIKKIVRSIRVTAMLILIGAVGLYIVQLMLASRSSLKGFADDNGRFETIIEALRLLPGYIFSGIGGSAADYTMSSMGVSVHNFFVAYLVQFGIFGGLAVNALLLSPVFDARNRYWYLLICVILGGMLFANWHNALYVVPLYLFFLLEGRNDSK
jgi:membrane protein